MECGKEGRKKKEGRGTTTKKRLLRGQLNAGPQVGNCFNGEQESESCRSACRKDWQL